MKHFDTPTDRSLLLYAEKLDGLMDNWENEIVEFKEAKAAYDADKIGRYFSALSNEANLRHQQCGWLVFGVSETHDRHLVGTNFKKGDRSLLERFKYEIAKFSTSGITFDEIVELQLNSNGKSYRVLLFKIPAAATGIPTAWHESYYARAGESLILLSQDKIDRIRAQERQDWSRQIVPKSGIEQLDPNAIQLARTKFKEKLEGPQAAEEIDQWSDAEFLSKMKLTVDGNLTNAALLLLGKEEYDYLFAMSPKVMWRLYGTNDSDRDYQIFSIPFINVIDKVFGKIRNLTYRYMPNQLTLFPMETQQYDTWLLRELLNNCIAHTNYRLGGRIYVNEFEDKINISNPGKFLPMTIERVLEPSYNPPFYLNQLLADTMVKFHMIDTAAMGIRRVFRIQREKYFPMPDYDLSTPNEVKVTVYGKVLNEAYMHILFDRPDLDLQTVFLLDRVTKGAHLSKEAVTFLRKNKLVEGRAPNLYISADVAKLTDQEALYIRNRGFNDQYYRDLIVECIRTFQPVKRKKIKELLWDKLPDVLTDRQKNDKITTLLTSLRRKGIIQTNSSNQQIACWILVGEEASNKNEQGT